MALQDKYKPLTDAASSLGVTNLQVREQDNVLYVDGDAPSGDVKDKLWNIYNQIDPDYRAGDLVLNVNVSSMVGGAQAEVVTDESNLNVRKGPGTDQPIVGKDSHRRGRICIRTIPETNLSREESVIIRLLRSC
jgi:hypothetical protein